MDKKKKFLGFLKKNKLLEKHTEYITVQAISLNFNNNNEGFNSFISELLKKEQLISDLEKIVKHVSDL